MSRTVYYLIPSLRAEGFRAHAGAYIVGVPQPTAVAGLAYALGLAVARHANRPLAHKPAVAYGVRDWSGFSGISLNQRQASDAPSAKLKTPAAIDDRVRASATLTLILELVFEGDEEGPAASEVAALLQGMRLQSASLFSFGVPRQFDSLADCARYVPKDSFFLVDAREDMRAALQDQPVTWKALVSFIERPADSQEYKPRWVPALVGWRALSAVKPHPRMREGACAHAFAEPVLGLARFRSAASFKSELRNLDPDECALLWRHAEEPLGAPHFVVKGTAPYTADFTF